MSIEAINSDIPDVRLRTSDYYFARQGETLLPPDEALLYAYVVSRDLILVRAACTGIEACIPVGYNWDPLPGLASVSPYVYWDFPRVPEQFVSQMLEISRKVSASKDTEALFHLSWLPPTVADELAQQTTSVLSGEGWVLEYPEQVASGERVRPVQTGAGSSSARSVIEVHTHPFSDAKFSPIDDRDESRGVKLYAMIATHAADFLTRLLITQDLNRFGCKVNAATGVVTSIYATLEEVARATRKPAVYLQRTARAHEAAA